MQDDFKKTYALLIHAHAVFQIRSSIDGCIYPPCVSNEFYLTKNKSSLFFSNSRGPLEEYETIST